MKDPFPIPPIPWLSEAITPIAIRFGFPTLPLHIHEVIFATGLYTFVHLVVSPRLSNWLAPKYYPKERGKRANWDSHVVSMFQALLIDVLALWTMSVDEERASMTDYQQRIWGYSGGCGLVQSFAAGYFVWDLVVSFWFVDVFGLGMLAHAASALGIYTLGYRPFLHFYGPVFILYELSTPFVNIHWFFDKLGMTGSWAQLINGITLIATFFGCRLVYGTYSSIVTYIDVWHGLWTPPSAEYIAEVHAKALQAGQPGTVMQFAQGVGPLPIWLAAALVVSNFTLNTLNWFWFFKMIAAVQKRFEPAAAAKKEALVSDAKSNGTATGSSTAAQAQAVKGDLKQRGPQGLVPNSKEMELEGVQ